MVGVGGAYNAACVLSMLGTAAVGRVCVLRARERLPECPPISHHGQRGLAGMALH